jgi:hypothetical protein
MIFMNKYTGNAAVIAGIGTNVAERGLTTQQFKDKFDEGLTAFVAWFNETHKTEFEAVAVGLDAKAPLASPAFTGAPALPSGTLFNGAVTLQTQLDSMKYRQYMEV